MNRIVENKAGYIFLTILGVLIAFGLDHYFLGEQMNVFVGLAIGIGPVFF